MMARFICLVILTLLKFAYSSRVPNGFASVPHTLIFHSEPEHYCVNLGEACSMNPNTKLDIHAIGPCCGESTKCKVTGHNHYGYDSGACCIMNRFDGCVQNGDCCDERDICVNGKCELDIPLTPPMEAPRPSPNNQASAAVIAPFESGPIINDNEYIHHRSNKEPNTKSNPVLHLWRTVSYGFAICIAMSLMLIFLFVALCKRKYNGYRKTFSISEVRSDHGTPGIVSDIIDCDLIEHSDRTDTENESESDHDFDDSTDNDEAV